VLQPPETTDAFNVRSRILLPSIVDVSYRREVRRKEKDLWRVSLFVFIVSRMIDKGHQRSYRYFSRVFQLAGIRKWDKVSCMGLRGRGTTCSSSSTSWHCGSGIKIGSCKQFFGLDRRSGN
jgi:hypothetical protein